MTESAAALSGRMADLAAAAAAPAWAAALAEPAGRAPATVPPPTFHDLAWTGLDLVDALVAAGRWDDARTHTAHLADYFTAARRRLHPVAAVAFQGLHDAVRARDPEEIEPLTSLLRDIFEPDPA